MSRFLLFLSLAALSAGAAHDGPQPEAVEGKGGGGSVCAPYTPGQHMTGPRYRQLVKDLGDTFSLEKLQTFNREAEQETTRALYQIFSNAKDGETRVFTTGFTEKGRNNHDGGDGLRVVWQRVVNGKLLSVITFWRYDGKGGIRLVGGPDSIRVRAQVAAPKAAPGEQAGTFVALSYSVNLDGAKVNSLEPGVYQDAKGERSKAASHLETASRADNCLVCHLTFPNRGLADHYFSLPVLEGSTIESPRFDEARFPTAPGPRAFIGSALEAAPAGDRDRVRRRLEALIANPRSTFVPPGLLQAVEARCRSWN